ncbi:MAG: hypothetical protein IJV76_12095, partial [Clostridia bacterium]|nr:hypothetical protein [Clostridia bacterium]
MKKVSPHTPFQKLSNEPGRQSLGANQKYKNVVQLIKFQTRTPCAYYVNPYSLKFFERGLGKTFFQ